MKNIATALGLFTELKFFRKRVSDDNIDNCKYTLCFFPLAGLILGAILSIWCFLAEGTPLVIIEGMVSAVVVAIFFGNVHFNAIHNAIGKSLGTIVYILAVFVLFISLEFKEMLAATAVLILSRALAIVMFYDSEKLVSGLYTRLFKASQRIVVTIITVVWIMFAVALLQMASLLTFAVVFVTLVIFYLIYSAVLKKAPSLVDYDVDIFIVVLEGILLLEINACKFAHVLSKFLG